MKAVNIFGVSQHAVSVLQDKLDSLDLSLCDARDIQPIISALNIVNVQGPTLAQKIEICFFLFLVKGYSRLKASLQNDYFSCEWPTGLGRSSKGEVFCSRL